MTDFFITFLTIFFIVGFVKLTNKLFGNKTTKIPKSYDDGFIDGFILGEILEDD
jgi:hypothetical protein